MGLVVTCLVTVTPLLGQITGLFWEADERPVFPHRVHAAFGYSSLLCSWATLFLGLNQYQVAWWWHLLLGLHFAFVTAFWAVLHWPFLRYLALYRSVSLARSMAEMPLTDDQKRQPAGGEVW